MTDAYNDKAGFVFVDGESYKKHSLPWAYKLLDPDEKNRILAKTKTFIAEAQSYDRDDLLTITGLYSIQGGIFSPGSDNPYPETVDVEFLQAITLTNEEKSKSRIPRGRLYGFWQELREQVFVLSHQSDRNNLSPLEELAQTHHAYYRNQYGDDFFDSMVRHITAEYDARYVRDGSVKLIGEFVALLRSELMARVRDYLERLTVVLNGDASEKLSAVEGYYGMVLGPALEGYEDRQLSIELYNVLEEIASDTLFIFDEEWISEYEKKGYPARAILQKLCSDASPEKLDLATVLKANPVWARPAVKVSNGFALFSLVTLMSFPFSILLVLLGEGAEEKLKLEKIRGLFVEQRLYDLLSQSLPSASIVRSGYWKREDGNRVETDLIVYLAGRLLIFEAKGALIPDRARSGKKDAIKHYLRRIWGKSTLQGIKLRDRIFDSGNPIEISDESGDVQITLLPSEIVSITRFSISIEQIGIFMNAPSLLKSEEVLDEDVVAAPCIILSELAIVLHNLRSEMSRLHYLVRRGEISVIRDFIGDELDLFATYLQFGFTGLPKEEALLMLLGASFQLPAMQDEDGKYSPPDDSCLRNSPYFESVLTAMHTKKSPALWHISLILFDVPFQEQLRFEQKMNAELARKSIPYEEWPIMCTHVTPLLDSFSFAVICFGEGVSGAEMRNAANLVVSGMIRENNSVEGFILVRIINSPNIYDAVYYAKP
ncbi:hypothetical protein LK542_24695 [Massilia sp. IC2-477]|uniref:hypothetical protein n=1 Tax=Massilia sp. IC2-477 TaxID=2887198 RepID=UPI001D11702D|nr:hypothetical protein [Massilia sp. IC2-477]MCC2958811.1 hypothetical protein [Massilia sp. IC2-477]